MEKDGREKKDLESSDEGGTPVCELFPWVLLHQKKKSECSEYELLDTACLLSLHYTDIIDEEAQSKLSL